MQQALLRTDGPGISPSVSCWTPVLVFPCTLPERKPYRTPGREVQRSHPSHSGSFVCAVWGSSLPILSSFWCMASCQTSAAASSASSQTTSLCHCQTSLSWGNPPKLLPRLCQRSSQRKEGAYFMLEKWPCHIFPRAALCCCLSRLSGAGRDNLDSSWFLAGYLQTLRRLPDS